MRLGNSVLAISPDATSVAAAGRMRDALDPLLVEDALWRASATDIQSVMQCITMVAWFERVDWTHGASHMRVNHEITPVIERSARRP